MTDWLRFAVMAACMSCCGAVPGCPAPSFVSSRLYHAEALPDLSWVAAAGTSAYLVEMVARVPEGPVVDRRSLRTVATSVELPRLDPWRATKITLSVVAECGERRAPAATRVVVVAPRQGCAPVSGLRVGTAGGARTVVWRAAAGVEHEVRVFDAVSGELAPSVLPPLPGGGVVLPGDAPRVVAVQPRCAGTVGATSYLFVD